MKFWKNLLLLIFILLSFRLLTSSDVVASPESDCSQDAETIIKNGLGDLCAAYWAQQTNALMPAQAKNKQDLANLQSQLSTLNKKIKAMTDQLKIFEKDIRQREENLAYAKTIFEQKARSQYISLRFYDPLLPFLSSVNASTAFREIAFRQRTADEDRKMMEGYANDLIKLKNDKETLQKNQSSLASLQKQVAEKEKFLSSEVEKVEGYLASLSAKQQELLAAKFSSAPVPLLAYTSLRGCSSDIGKSSGFSPRFGFFSLGVPNKTGLNQYGAKGRAEAGQGYEEILKAYYANFEIVNYGTGFNITVNGTNPYNQTFSNATYNIEEYLKHLYEMPSSWDSKALQAQAVAARTYALAVTNNGQSSIKPNEYGQVVKKEENDQAWKDAVNATSGKVMVQMGTNTPISAWYSSTHGGVVLKSGQIGWADKPWTKQVIDTQSGSVDSISQLQSNAYDRQSPWFYCDWGYRSEYNNTAWLKEEEVRDIVNAYLLWEKDNSTLIHLSQTDKGIANTWSSDQVRQEIVNRGGSPITSIDSISVGWDNSGISKTITINGRGLDAQKFKNLFNLRAPANIQIKPSCQPDLGLSCDKMYALFDIVRE